MAEITDHVVFDVLLLSDVAPQASFGIQLALIDDLAIPVDKRFVFTAPLQYEDDFADGTFPRKYSTPFFSQAIAPEVLMFGRWVKTATAPFYVWGSANEQDYLVWKAITDGEFRVQNSTPVFDDITGCDFSAVTAIDQVYAVIEAKLQALVAPNIPGLDTATCSIDNLGRIMVSLPVTQSGSATPTIEIIPIPAGVGTDLTLLMDVDNGESISGYDVETPVAAIDAISAIDNSWYNVEVPQANDVELLTVGVSVEGKKKQCTLVTKNVDCYDPAKSTDLMSEAAALKLTRSLVIYDAYKDDDQYVGAAVEGRMLPTVEGATNYAYRSLTLVKSSNKDKPLDVGQRKAMKEKFGNWLETVGSTTYLYPGVNSGNVEKRLVRGIDWFEARCQEDYFSKLLTKELMGWDNETITEIQNTLDTFSEIAIDRGIFVNTPGRPFVITLPDADDFTQGERATRKMTITNAFTGWANSAVNDILVRGTVTI